MRRRIFTWYERGLRGVAGLLQLNQETPHGKSTYWLVTAILDPQYQLKKEPLIAYLREQRIDARPFFYPLSSMPTFAPYCRGRNMRKLNPVAYAISPYGISLPSAASLTETDVTYVCDVLKDALRRADLARKATSMSRKNFRRLTPVTT